ncbi:MAG: transcriptional regulator [Actinobacteria bacterium]|nr:transcriptional regulator [Actinomycetota bacterium]
MDDYKIVGNASKQEFESARFRSLLTSLKYFLIGRNNELLSFEKIKKEFKLYKQRYLGIQTVPVDTVVGSFDRYRDFDRYFLPKKAHLQQRWAEIHNLIARDVILPPVKLYKIGEIYFVIDGNHRVSVSKKLGVKYIDAEVTEFITDIPITSDMDPKDIIILAEKENFLNVTGLKQNRPEIKIRITIPGQYDFLLSQIDKLMIQLNENKKADEELITFKEASIIWYDNIYLPAIDIIKNYGILEKFPNRTKTDLYIWINEHKRYLSLKYGRDVVIKFAAKDFLMRYSKNPFRRFKLRLINLKSRNYKNFYNRKLTK